MKLKHILLIAVTTASPASAVTLYDSNFDSLTTGALANSASISTGLTARIGATTTINVGDPGSLGDKRLEFTDNNSTFVSNGAPLIFSTIAAANVSTGATGNNMLVGSFDLTRVGLSPAGNVPFQFYIQAGTGESTSGANMIFRMEFSLAGAVNYFRYTTSANQSTALPSFTMATDTAYRFSYSIDLSSTTQDSFGFSVATVALPNTSLASVSAINTANTGGALLPGIAVFRGGSNSAAQNASPTWYLDNASLTAIPEPSSFAIVAGLAALGLTTSRRRSRV